MQYPRISSGGTDRLKRPGNVEPGAGRHLRDETATARHELRLLKVIFLDFDGVIVTQASSFRRSATGTVADPDAIHALSYLVAETGASLVITSTWRLEYSILELSALLRSWGIQADILGVTPSRSCRGDEIQAWLDKFSEPAQIDSFVILDDLTDMGTLSSRLISTEFETGLTMEHARQALEYLKPSRI